MGRGIFGLSCLDLKQNDICWPFLLLKDFHLFIPQEDPGESLSDCDKDDEEESVEEGYLKGDENESEDDFMVPDGYLSENEVPMKLASHLVFLSFMYSRW